MSQFSFPNLTAFRNSVFPPVEPNSITSTPGGSVLSSVMGWIQSRYRTKPRSTATSLRNPATQSGAVLSENGEVALRSGHTQYDHQVGSSVVLQSDGTVLITAPGGLNVVGTYWTSNSPTEAIAFSGGQYRIGPHWTKTPVVIPVSNAPKFFDTFFVQDVSGKPIPLTLVLSTAEFYQTPKNVPVS